MIGSRSLCWSLPSICLPLPPAAPRLPLACPSLQLIRFCSEVFHPSVDPESWELDLSGKWSLWRSPWDEGALDSPSCDWVWHLLKHLRKTFLKIELKVRTVPHSFIALLLVAWRVPR